MVCASENVRAQKKKRCRGLVTNYGVGGGYKTGVGGGHVKFYPSEKGGRKSFSHAEVGQKNFRGSF